MSSVVFFLPESMLNITSRMSGNVQVAINGFIMHVVPCETTQPHNMIYDQG